MTIYKKCFLVTLFILIIGIFSCTIDSGKPLSDETDIMQSDEMSLPSKAPGLFYMLNKYSQNYFCQSSKAEGAKIGLYGPQIPPGHYMFYEFYRIKHRSGYFLIKHKYSQKYLCAENYNGAPLILKRFVPVGQEDKFLFQIIDTNDGYYKYIQHKYSGKYVAGGGPIGGNGLIWGPIPQGHHDRYKFRLSSAQLQ